MWQWKLLIDPPINRKQGKQKGQNNYKNCDSTKEKEMICQTEFSRPKPSPWSQVHSNKTFQHSHANWACSQIHAFHFHTRPAPPSSTKNLSQSQTDVMPWKPGSGPIFHFSSDATRTETTPDQFHSCRLGMGWEIVCAEMNLAHPEMEMIPVQDIPCTVRQMQARKPYICNSELLPGSAGNWTRKKIPDDKWKESMLNVLKIHELS